MFDQLNSLAHTLERMHSLYERVAELLESERGSLAKMNFESLYAELREKDEVLSIIRKLDKERLKIQDHYAMLNGLNTADVTLKSIGEQLIEEGSSSRTLGERLLLIRSRIQIIVEKIKDRVGVNEKFIEKSVANLRAVAEIYSEGVEKSAPSRVQHATYTKKQVVQKSPKAAGSILEKRL